MAADSQKSILVTGASTGIGRCIAERLAAAGHTVFATARKDRDLHALDAIENVVALELDVRDPAQIHDAHRDVERAGRGLDGVVNNAGVGWLRPLAECTDDQVRDIFEVNVFGVHRVTNAFLSMLVERGGRVVNIGSQGGSITRALAGPYAMTKHALEAYTSALAEELRPAGVSVSVVQPGGIRSAMTAGGPAFDPSRPESNDNRQRSSPDIVADAVEHALFDPAPRLRYLVGTRWEGDRVIDMMLERLLDANESPAHRYTRDELVARLDGQIARRRDAAGGMLPREENHDADTD